MPHPNGTERRKYARFDTSIEVIFDDRKKTIGKLANISRSGCLIVPDLGHLRAIGSLVIFRAYTSGRPESVKRAESEQQVGLEISQMNEAIKVIARVVRHQNYNGQPAMSIELFGLNGDDMLKWNDFLAKVARKKIRFSYENTASDHKTVPVPVYQIKFKSMESMRRFFPSEIDEYFFIQTPSERKPGELIKVKLIHPDQKREISLDLIVEKFGNHPEKMDWTGIIVRYENPSNDLKEKINTFLDYNLYK